jgi:hypothetical protein
MRTVAMKRKALIGAVVRVLVFLAGFLPQYVRANRLDNELRQAKHGYGSAEIRDLAGLAYVQANQKNYGIAAETIARFFGRVRELANQTSDADARKSLEDLLAPRDKITAELAKGDAGVMGDLQDLFAKTRHATGGPRQ